MTFHEIYLLYRIQCSELEIVPDAEQTKEKYSILLAKATSNKKYTHVRHEQIFAKYNKDMIGEKTRGSFIDGFDIVLRHR